MKITIVGLLFLSLSICGCDGPQTADEPERTNVVSGLRGASSYTPYDAFAMLWARSSSAREIVWTSSGQESGQLLVSKAEPQRRPDWVLCTQGVVAGLAARGESPIIIASVYVSDSAILPVFRAPRRPIEGSKSLFIPRSSIEFAFDRLLQREGAQRSDVRVPAVEKPSFPQIVSLLEKPVDDKDSIDFGILVDPFITNLLNGHPGAYELGKGGLYEMHYSVVVRKDDLVKHRSKFKILLSELLEAENEFRGLKSDQAFYSSVWGRAMNGKPDLLPQLMTYRREPAAIKLEPLRLRQLLSEEIEYLAAKYPDQLSTPEDISMIVDPTLLKEVAPGRVR